MEESSSVPRYETVVRAKRWVPPAPAPAPAPAPTEWRGTNEARVNGNIAYVLAGTASAAAPDAKLTVIDECVREKYKDKWSDIVVDFAKEQASCTAVSAGAVVKACDLVKPKMLRTSCRAGVTTVAGAVCSGVTTRRLQTKLKQAELDAKQECLELASEKRGK